MFYVDPTVHHHDEPGKEYAVFTPNGGLYADGLSKSQADTLAWRMNLGPL